MKGEVLCHYTLTTNTNLLISSHSQILDTTANYVQSRDSPEAVNPRFVVNKYSTLLILHANSSQFNPIS